MRAFDFNLVQRDQASFATRALTCVALLVRIKIVSCVIVFLDLCVFLMLEFGGKPVLVHSEPKWGTFIPPKKLIAIAIYCNILQYKIILQDLIIYCNYCCRT